MLLLSSNFLSPGSAFLPNVRTHNMTKIRAALSVLALTSFLLACGQPNSEPTKPQPNSSEPIGAISLQMYIGQEQGENLPVPFENQISQQLNTRSTFPASSAVTFSQASYTMRTYANPDRWFFTANYKVTNSSNAALQNLSLIAKTRAGVEIGGTAITSIVTANNQSITDVSTARNFEPSNYLRTTDGLVNPGTADFQAFTDTEATQIKTAAIAGGIPLTTNDTILNYGFVTRKSATSKVIPAVTCKTSATDQCNVGNVSVTFKAPAFLVAGAIPSLPLKLTFNFLLTSEATNRVTRAEETTASVVA
jgi:hypothetical protein